MVQSFLENYTLTDENSSYEIAVSSSLGDRAEQQDRAAVIVKSDECLILICDGMGGHRGGKLASTVAVEKLTKIYEDQYPNPQMLDVLECAVEEADKSVAMLQDESGEWLRAGSTMVLTYIKESELNWLSVGDSRLYLIRNGEIHQLSTDHIYLHLLEDQLKNGGISEDTFAKEAKQGQALISFLGMNGLRLLDKNKAPLPLQRNDRILLASDGLYKLLPDEVIARIIDNFTNIQDALRALAMKAQRAAKNSVVKRDNMTVAIIRVK